MPDSPFRMEYVAEYGDMMFLNAAFDRRSSTEELIADKQQENKLIVEYGELVGSIEEIPFEGGVVGSDEIDAFKEDADAERRLAAFRAEGRCWREISGRLDEVFDKLIRLRDGMGKKLGYEGYTDLAYCILKRTFTREDVRRFREAVVNYVVPIADRIKPSEDIPELHSMMPGAALSRSTSRGSRLIKSFPTITELLKNAGLYSPFDAECLKTVCETAERWLDDFDLAGID